MTVSYLNANNSYVKLSEIGFFLDKLPEGQVWGGNSYELEDFISL